MAFTFIEWLILSFLVVTSIVTTIVILSRKYYNKRWNYTYNVLEDAEGSGRLIPTKKGRCKLVKVSDSGVEIFYLPKLNKYRTAYGRKSGLNHIVWAVDSAGYWHNVYFQSIDKKLNEIGINIVSPQARLAEASTRKIIKEMYKNETFMDKYGTMISFGLLFICICALGVSQYMSYNKQVEVTNANLASVELTNQNLEIQKDVLNTVDDILTKIDTVRAGGSGLVPAT